MALNDSGAEMAKFLVYALYSASQFVGEFEAETEIEAEDMACKLDNHPRGLCHQCSGDIDCEFTGEYTVDRLGGADAARG